MCEDFYALVVSLLKSGRMMFCVFRKTSVCALLRWSLLVAKPVNLRKRRRQVLLDIILRSGTMNDTSRLPFYLASHFGHPVQSVMCYRRPASTVGQLAQSARRHSRPPATQSMRLYGHNQNFQRSKSKPQFHFVFFAKQRFQKKPLDFGEILPFNCKSGFVLLFPIRECTTCLFRQQFHTIASCSISMLDPIT
uniref:Uncharacterized protein n=1 Tax=Romanomermis culicivorax TaxID=13658 RepID=A0A915L641_ROMCU